MSRETLVGINLGAKGVEKLNNQSQKLENKEENYNESVFSNELGNDNFTVLEEINENNPNESMQPNYIVDSEEIATLRQELENAKIQSQASYQEGLNEGRKEATLAYDQGYEIGKSEASTLYEQLLEESKNEAASAYNQGYEAAKGELTTAQEQEIFMLESKYSMEISGLNATIENIEANYASDLLEKDNEIESLKQQLLDKDNEIENVKMGLKSYYEAQFMGFGNDLHLKDEEIAQLKAQIEALQAANQE